MKKIIHYSILFLSIFFLSSAKAQYVSIPDVNFKIWLTQLYPGCMIGNQLDTTCAAIVNEDSVLVGGLNLTSIDGIQYFDNLWFLKCSNNHLQNLPSLPNKLQYLKCDSNELSSLPTLPDSLNFLNCSHNKIQVLPNLPITLFELNCSFDSLSSLPQILPNNLMNIFCQHNYITALPTLPANLSYIDCSLNQLTSLPLLPQNIFGSLICSNNFITSLPTLPNSLTYLNCSNNQLSGLPSLPSNLIQLSCSYNSVTSLPTLPNTVQTLDLAFNQLDSLPELSDSLLLIDVSGNHLSSIPSLPNHLNFLIANSNLLTYLPAIPNNLKTLVASDNQLSSLPNLPNSLEQLYVSDNNLTALPAIPSFLINLSCYNNQLSYIPELPFQMYQFLSANNNITCIHNLPQVSGSGDISGNPSLTCVPNQTNYSLGLPMCVDNDSVYNPNNCQGVNIVGHVYTQLDTNCTFDASDLRIENIPVKLYDAQNNLVALSYTSNGVFSFTALQPDSFHVVIDDVNLPIAMDCNQSNQLNLHLDSTNQTIYHADFPVLCESAYDIKVQSIQHNGYVFPGQVHQLFTELNSIQNLYNLSCDSSIYFGEVSIKVTGPVSFLAPAAGALTPSISGNTFSYNINDFTTIHPTSFGLQFITDTTAQSGQTVCVFVEINPNPTDADTLNNTYNYCYQVINSLDPNMKEVYPTNVLPGYQDWFTYTIHFQNTGTAPAFNIRLRDTLDTELDINTFEFMNASHASTTQLNGHVLTVRFNNIMLPDSTSNQDASMGYYQYRIKPFANQVYGTNITNTAFIYFDYNAAVVTNTTENHFDITTNLSSLTKENVVTLVYPNPSKGIFTFSNYAAIKKVDVYNLFGELIFTQCNGKSIDLTEYPKGIYITKINGEKVCKLVKE